jgi:UDP-N-acetylglucosamine 2-epimerase (non-hydrolysing)/GDP/UDP-N,N'-diacetylbacillosamine 2-epimerase (hydrolysing)
VAKRKGARIFVNLDSITYWSLLRQVDLFIGNSSSGIIETASFALPTVNVGIRQRGREHGANVLDAPANADEIVACVNRAMSREFRESLRGMANPYGDGTAAAKIARTLAETVIDEGFVVKRSFGLSDRQR